jgi:tRNA(Ile)-lysidine synthase
VAHVNHGLRPEAADDARWVGNLAGSLGLPFRQLRVPPGTWDRLRGRSIEAEARRLRRTGLRLLARRAGAAWILLGHTRDDQAETVLLNLLRGSGVRGLAGMDACRPPWIRPLLGIGREELRGYAVRNGLAWREDATNQDPRFLRNRLRLRLLPWLESEFHPGVARVLARTADTLRPARRFLESEAEVAWVRCCLEENRARIRLDPRELATYHQAIVDEVLRMAFRRLRGGGRDLKRAHVSALSRALSSGRQGLFSFPAGIQAALNHRELSLSHLTDEM